MRQSQQHRRRLTELDVVVADLRMRVLPSVVRRRPELRGVRFGRRRHSSAEREIRRTRVQRDGHECQGATLA
jgi:hypothetical protein